MARIVALIPARAGSKGVPNKNIRPLAGRPLLAWTIAACRKVPSIHRVIVSTDSPEYAALSEKWGAEAPFLRPAEISGDRSTDYEFIVHAMQWLDSNGDRPDFFVHMRPTTPLREPEIVEKAIQAFSSARSATALRSVHEMPESAYKAFEIAPGGALKRVCSSSFELDVANNARQEFPLTYHPNGYVDVLATAYIRQSGLIHGNRVMAFITPSVVEIDAEEDFDHLDFKLARNSQISKRLFG